jgi:hypothetical protein
MRVLITVNFGSAIQVGHVRRSLSQVNDNMCDRVCSS